MNWSPCPEPAPGDRAACDADKIAIAPRAADLSEMTVRRALPSVQRRMVGPFIFFDQIGPTDFLTDQGWDVRPHPHINLATRACLLSGRIWRRDSIGADQLIEPGAVNWMRTDKGVVHSGRTDDEKKATGQRLFGVQSWVALPADQGESAPAFLHDAAGDIPVIEDRGVAARLIAGEAFGAVSPLKPASPTPYVDAALEAGAVVPVDATHEERAVYVQEGAVEIAVNHLEADELLILPQGDPHAVRAVGPARVMPFDGEPMEGSRWIWWNVVPSQSERIKQRKEEWARGHFDTVPGDEAEFIPPPEGPGKPRRAVGRRLVA